jgi:hypothetical protein
MAEIQGLCGNMMGGCSLALASEVQTVDAAGEPGCAECQESLTLIETKGQSGGARPSGKLVAGIAIGVVLLGALGFAVTRPADTIATAEQFTDFEDVWGIPNTPVEFGDTALTTRSEEDAAPDTEPEPVLVQTQDGVRRPDVAPVPIRTTPPASPAPSAAAVQAPPPIAAAVQAPPPAPQQTAPTESGLAISATLPAAQPEARATVQRRTVARNTSLTIEPMADLCESDLRSASVITMQLRDDIQLGGGDLLPSGTPVSVRIVERRSPQGNQPMIVRLQAVGLQWNGQTIDLLTQVVPIELRRGSVVGQVVRGAAAGAAAGTVIALVTKKDVVTGAAVGAGVGATAGGVAASQQQACVVASESRFPFRLTRDVEFNY